MLEIRLLGKPDLHHQGEAVSLSSRKAWALLAYLVLEDGPHPRSVLDNLLWPTHPPEKARGNLRQTLYLLKQALGNSAYCLRVAQDTLQFVPDASIRVDVLDLQSAAHQSTDNATIADVHYAQPLLHNWRVDASTEFDEWLATARARCSQWAALCGAVASEKPAPPASVCHNLPAPTHNFIGRHAERQQVDRLLSTTGARLLTIAGPGGIGKTQLALAYGHQQLARYPDGVWFVSLADVTQGVRLPALIGNAMGLLFAPDRPAKPQLLEILSERECLLILDNFEHLIDHSAFVSDLLEASPRSKILVTSREVLRVRGEYTFALAGLPLHEIADDGLSDAMRLFQDRAQRTQWDFEITPASHVAIDRACRLVQGHPLAIVLICSWLDTCSLDEILAEFQKGLGRIQTSWRDAPARHSSIQAAFDTSWQRLSTKDQRILKQLSLLIGFSRQLAEAITDLDLPTLQYLINRSMIQYDAQRQRYRIHELLRQFIVAKLQDDPAELERYAQARHRYFVQLAARQYLWDDADDYRAAMVEAHQEFDNMYNTWQSALDQRRVGAINDLLVGMSHTLMQTCLFDLAVRDFRQVLTLLETAAPSDEHDIAAIRAETHLAWFLHMREEHATALQILQTVLGKAAAASVSETVDGVIALMFFCWVMRIVEGYGPMKVSLDKMLTMAHALDKPMLLAMAYSGLAEYDFHMSKAETCIQTCHLGIHYAGENALISQYTYANLVVLYARQGNLPQALVFMRRLLRVSADTRASFPVFTALAAWAAVLHFYGRSAEALEHVELVLASRLSDATSRIAARNLQAELLTQVSAEQARRINHAAAREASQLTSYDALAAKNEALQHAIDALSKT